MNIAIIQQFRRFLFQQVLESVAVCFAAIPPAQDSGHQNSGGDGSPGGQILFRDLKVAVAEDDELNAFVLSRMLTQSGAKVFLSRNGLELLHLVPHHQPHIIILDHHMELLDGEETLIRLKRQASTRNIPVILITGDTDEEVRKSLDAAGAVAVLGKPVDFRALADVFQTILNRSV
ncbi:response regulator [Chitinophaga sp. NPDC101104]|uniref:response regulator n=1 Tax=Chitinophaga sp. NPDC101104 TaxID=3390561 RepID=UPI003D075205